MKKFSNVILLIEGKKVPFAISWFKKGKSKITKDQYRNYSYTKAFNFGLFYIGYCKRNCFKPSIDFSSRMGILRIIKK